MTRTDREPDPRISRRTFLWSAAAVAATGLVACTSEPDDETDAPVPDAASPTSVAPIVCDPAAGSGGGSSPLWATAIANGIVYGSSAATWQLQDTEYRRLFERETALVFTEDDLLWWRLKPTPDAPLDFRFGDRLVGFAEQERLAVLGAHLVWDEGFGDGWTDDDVWTLSADAARRLLYGTIDEVVAHYRGRIAAWIVANEVLDGTGLRLDFPWHATIGPSFVPESFRRAHEADPDALLLLNDFGYETDDDLALAEDKRATTLELLDELLADDVPVHGLGVQAHLAAAGFDEAFDADAYRAFLGEVAARGLGVWITELDVLDDALPPDPKERDAGVAAALQRYLDVALAEPAVSTVVTFGLSDRYTWLQEDFPRDDGAPRRPLLFDEALDPKPAFDALRTALSSASRREPPFLPPRC
ncbi:MAG TPA: endo-1,4-beta-xylanase [Actinomycetota bacterium]|nr:endo-1,4-beta-xylanase [Actinomycetota bacterium]